MTSLTDDIESMLQTLQELEERMKELKKSVAVNKERKPNPWILFTKRIDALMKENNTPFKTIGESKQFASSLKKEKPYAEWLDAEIVAKRNDWLVEFLLACPVCNDHPTDDVMKHQKCIVEFATKDATPMKNPVGAWMCAVSTVRSRPTEVIFVDEETEPPLPGTV